eukprot:scaffold156546_cov17-Prasinocladus_malaysianus.AAC.3
MTVVATVVPKSSGQHVGIIMKRRTFLYLKCYKMCFVTVVATTTIGIVSQNTAILALDAPTLTKEMAHGVF